MNDYEMIDSDQVAHVLGCSKRTVWRMLEAGELPAPIRFNRKVVRWCAATLRAWMQEKGARPLPSVKVPPPSPPRPAPAPAEGEETKRLLTAKQLARMLQLSSSGVYRVAKRLGLQKRAVGQGYAVTDAQLRELMKLRVLPAPKDEDEEAAA